MTLLEWMTKNNISSVELFRVLGDGASPHGIRKWLKGERIPRKKMQLKLKQLTKGEVTPNDWIKE